MKAVVWHGPHDVRVDRVDDPGIVNPHDAIVEITSTAICGSDLHLYNGYIPAMQSGDVMGHEFMGRIVAVGPQVCDRRVGERVIVAFAIACGACSFCRSDLWSLCDNTNPNAMIADKLFGHATAGIFGYSHLTGGYWGGQAQFARVPFADVNTFVVPDALPDEKVLFLTDIFPTGYMAAENCAIAPGDVVAVWGCGPVGQFAIRSAFMLGAARVIAIDRIDARLDLAGAAGAEPVNFDHHDVLVTLDEMTAGRGPDACIDAVGMEAAGHAPDALVDKAKQLVRLETDRAHVLRTAIQACRKGGVVSVPGVYGGYVDTFPVGAFMEKGLTMRTGQTHVHRYVGPLLERIASGEIDPSFIVSQRAPLAQAPKLYRDFAAKSRGAIKFVLDPAA